MIRSLEEQLVIAKELAKQHLQEKYPERYNHTISVANKVLELLPEKNKTQIKTLIASYMHDIFKFPNLEDNKYLNREDLKELEEAPFLWHALLASRYYLDYVGNDIEIYNAIKHHITSYPTDNKVMEVLYLADFIEDLRAYKNCIKAREMYREDFYYSTLYFISKVVCQYTLKHEGIPTKIQLAAKDFYYKMSENERNQLIITALEKIRAENILITALDDPFCDFTITANLNSKAQINGFLSQLELLIEKSPYEILKIDGINTEWLVLDISGTLVNIRVNNTIYF